MIRRGVIRISLVVSEITLIVIGAWDARGLRGFAWDEKSHQTHLKYCELVSYKPCVACVG
ncbi:MAG: hypothetical protein M0P00_09420 [Bacteroidaceae bacterium]|nr:hypothetical protein [Bacteroidaceae bacterium]